VTELAVGEPRTVAENERDVHVDQGSRPGNRTRRLRLLRLQSNPMLRRGRPSAPLQREPLNANSRLRGSSIGQEVPRYPRALQTTARSPPEQPCGAVPYPSGRGKRLPVSPSRLLAVGRSRDNETATSLLTVRAAS
jgi:hypothetical protein